MALDNSFNEYHADDVVGISGDAPVPSHTNVLERLRWFKKAEPLLPVAVRLESGEAYVLEEANHFTIDDSGNILAIGRPTGAEIINVADIHSVRSVRDQSAIVEQVVATQKATPFQPYRIKFGNGIRWTVDRPERLIVTPRRLFLAEGQEGNHGFEKVREVGIEWLDSIELMPGESK